MKHFFPANLKNFLNVIPTGGCAEQHAYTRKKRKRATIAEI